MDTERLTGTKNCRPIPGCPWWELCAGMTAVALVTAILVIMLLMPLFVMPKPALHTVSGTLPDGQQITFTSVPLLPYAEGVYTADKGMEAYLLIGTNFNAMSVYPIGYRKAIWLFSKLPKEETSEDHITLYNSDERRHIHIKKGPNGWDVEFGPKHKDPQNPCEPLPWWLRKPEEPVSRWIKETAGNWDAFNPCATNLLEGIHSETSKR